MATNDDINKTGVYKIVNRVNGRVYYGGTTTSFKERWRSHTDTLKANRHGCHILQRSYNKHGIAAFEFSVVEFVDRPIDISNDEFRAIIAAAEQVYLDKYWDGGNRCYNIRKKAAIGGCYERTEESREELGTKQRGKKRPFNTSGYAGVHKTISGWSARISIKTKRIPLGTYTTPEEASRVYEEALELVKAGKGPIAINRHNKVKSSNKSGYVGVMWHKACNKWVATCYKVFLGAFDTPEEASVAYQEALQLIQEGNEPKRKPRSNNATGINGVQYEARSNRWIASIQHNKKQFRIGAFTTLEKASAARIEAEQLIADGKAPINLTGKTNKSGYDCVYSTGTKWAVRFKIGDTRFYIGNFNTPEEASAAYQVKLSELNKDKLTT